MTKILLIVILLSLVADIQGYHQRNHKNENLQQNCESPKSLTGSEFVGQTFDVIKYETKKPIFQFSCNQNKLYVDGRSRILDGIIFQILDSTSYQDDAVYAKNINDFISKKSQFMIPQVVESAYNEFNVQLNEVMGEKTQPIKELRSLVQNLNSEKYYQQITASVQLQNLTISDYSLLQLNQDFIYDAQQLPDTYDQRLYFAFLDKYGTHFVDSLVLGAQVQQTGTIESEFFNQYSKEQYNQCFNDEFQYSLYQDYSLSESFLLMNEDELNEFNLQSDSFYQESSLHDIQVISSSNLNFVGNDYTRLQPQYIKEDPIVISQRLVEISKIFETGIASQNLGSKTGNVKKAIKAKLQPTTGCPDESAINYDRDALFEDMSICVYSVFYGSYQMAFNLDNNPMCTDKSIEKQDLKNQLTNEYSCQSGTKSVLIANYTSLVGCDVQQFFCMRSNQNFHPDLIQSLQICENSNVSNNFFSETSQYHCTQDQQDLFVNFKEDYQIQTCQMSFCMNKKSNNKGVKGFLQRYEGVCQGVQTEFGEAIKTTEGDADLKFLSDCEGGCLIQYGKIQVQEDCLLNQYVCLKEQQNKLQCVQLKEESSSYGTKDQDDNNNNNNNSGSQTSTNTNTQNNNGNNSNENDSNTNNNNSQAYQNLKKQKKAEQKAQEAGSLYGKALLSEKKRKEQNSSTSSTTETNNGNTNNDQDNNQYNNNYKKHHNSGAGFWTYLLLLIFFISVLALIWYFCLSKGVSSQGRINTSYASQIQSQHKNKMYQANNNGEIIESRRAFKPYEQDQFGYAAYPNPQDQQSEQQQYNIKNENEEPFKLIPPVQEQAQEEMNKEQIQQEKKPRYSAHTQQQIEKVHQWNQSQQQQNQNQKQFGDQYQSGFNNQNQPINQMSSYQQQQNFQQIQQPSQQGIISDSQTILRNSRFIKQDQVGTHYHPDQNQNYYVEEQQQQIINRTVQYKQNY